VNDDRSLSDLASDAARGDRGAVESLHRRLDPGLRRLFLARTGGREELAEDLCQRAWAACWRAVAGRKYEPARAAFSTYLYAIASRIWLEYLRKSGRGLSTEELTEYEADQLASSPAAEARLAEAIDLVRECLRGEAGGLSEEERWILRESAMGASDRDLARRMGVAPSTMNTRKRQALERLRRFLAGRGPRGDSAEHGG
jgi:RNA polymerase sigma factor (sigma-70 family)